MKAEIKRKRKDNNIPDEVKPDENISTAPPQPEAIPQDKDILTEAESIIESTTIEWKPKARVIKDGTKTVCVVVANGEWFGECKVDLKDLDTKEYEWGEYGTVKPFLVEKDGKLIPYRHSDKVGESPTRIFKAANPEGFKESFRHRQGLLEKFKVGLMVALVIATLFLIYVISQQKKPAEDTGVVMQTITEVIHVG